MIDVRKPSFIRASQLILVEVVFIFGLQRGGIGISYLLLLISLIKALSLNQVLHTLRTILLFASLSSLY